MLILHLRTATLKHADSLKSIPIQIFSSLKQLNYYYGPKQDQNNWGQNKLIRLKGSALRHMQEVVGCNRFCREREVGTVTSPS